MFLRKSSLAAVCVLSSTVCGSDTATTVLNKYRELLDWGTYEWANIKGISPMPRSRYHTFRAAFELFERNNGKTIVELGTTRSFVHGGLPGCCDNNSRYWTPNEPKNWDWGAGGFTRLAAECLEHCNPIIHTIDIDSNSIYRCKIITEPFKRIIRYHTTSSQAFLNQCSPESIDLLYMDTGGVDHQTALLHLEEAKIIVAKNLIKKGGLLLIDDVKSGVSGDSSGLGKAKYSIPFLLAHNFEIIEDEYQVLLRRTR